MKYIIPALALITLSGCASIVGNSSYPVAINSSPSEAKFTISNESGNDGLSVIDSSLSGWYIGNLLFGGIVGLLIVDPATGAMWKLPENTSTSLTKNP